MEQKEKSAQELRALEQLKKAQANLAKVRREERAKTRKEQDHHKFIMGGIIVKYFPEAYEFTEQEMCRIIACAFKKAEEKDGKPIGFFKKSQAEEYKRQHQTELTTYKFQRSALKNLIKKPDKKITAGAWRKELADLQTA